MTRMLNGYMHVAHEALRVGPKAKRAHLQNPGDSLFSANVLSGLSKLLLPLLLLPRCGALTL